MTRKGNYSIELVDATTSQPFKQHPGKNGIDAYFEVEPGLEYFIRVINHSNNTVLVYYEVDGKSLGFYNIFKPGESLDQGLWAYDQITATSVNKSLQFHKSFSHSSRGVDNNNNNNIGIVSATIYEYIKLEGYYDDQAFTSKLNDDNQVRSGNNEDSKKYLKSSSGKKQKMTHDSGRRPNYKVGRILETIKVKYCSVVGLIADNLPSVLMFVIEFNCHLVINQQLNIYCKCKLLCTVVA